MVVIGSEAPVHIFRTRHSDSEIAPNAQSDNQGQASSRGKRAIASALTVLGTVSLLGLAACPADLEDPARFDIQGTNAGASSVAGGTGMGGGSAGGSASPPAPACVQAIFATCAISVCHKAGVGAAADLNLTADGVTGRLVDVDAKHVDAEPATGCVPGKYIDTANRPASWLLLKLTKTKAELNCGEAMPIGAPLTADQLTCIQDYVNTATK